MGWSNTVTDAAPASQHIFTTAATGLRVGRHAELRLARGQDVGLDDDARARASRSGPSRRASRPRAACWPPGRCRWSRRCRAGACGDRRRAASLRSRSRLQTGAPRRTHGSRCARAVPPTTEEPVRTRSAPGARGEAADAEEAAELAALHETPFAEVSALVSPLSIEPERPELHVRSPVRFRAGRST